MEMPCFIVACECFMILTILFCKQIEAFGGGKVMNLLRTIEKYHQRFKMPPIGPIGAHLVIWCDAFMSYLTHCFLSLFVYTHAVLFSLEEELN